MCVNNGWIHNLNATPNKIIVNCFFLIFLEKKKKKEFIEMEIYWFSSNVLRRVNNITAIEDRYWSYIDLFTYTWSKNGWNKQGSQTGKLWLSLFLCNCLISGEKWNRNFWSLGLLYLFVTDLFQYQKE